MTHTLTTSELASLISDSIFLSCTFSKVKIELSIQSVIAKLWIVSSNLKKHCTSFSSSMKFYERVKLKFNIIPFTLKNNDMKKYVNLTLKWNRKLLVCEMNVKLFSRKVNLFKVWRCHISFWQQESCLYWNDRCVLVNHSSFIYS